MREAITVEINDDQGNPHTYVITQRGASEGFDLFGRLSKILAPGIGKGIGNTKITGVGEAGTAPHGADQPPGDELDVDLDLGALGIGFGDVAASIMAEGGARFVQEILKYSTRDGKLLSNKVAFDQAYQGNYGELIEATGRVLKAEYGGMLTRLPFVQQGMAALKQLG